MLRAIPLLILASIAGEIASIIWVGSALGIIPTIFLLFAGGIIGISLIRSAGANFAQALRSPVEAASLSRGLAGKAIARIGSGILFMVPGFMSDGAAVLLLLPPVAGWLNGKLKPKTAPPPGMRARPPGLIIDAEAVEITAEAEPPTSGRNRP